MFDPTQLNEVVVRQIKKFRDLQSAGLICLDGDFFPSVHYPPITMYPQSNEGELFHGYTLPQDGLFVIYAHFPFCASYCRFCHYPVRIGADEKEKDVYIDTLLKEIDLYAARLGVGMIKARSVLIGGGTPTYLTPRQLERFLDGFVKRIDLESNRQFNYDVDPVTLLGQEGKERMSILRDHGVDRLTIGIQSFDDGMLRVMNRHHNSTQAEAAVRAAMDNGFHVCIEFIYGYPGQDMLIWMQTMEKALSLGVDEIQNYRLKIIPYGDHKGLISDSYQNQGVVFPSLEDIISMKIAAIHLLRSAGYHENLTRVFTRGKEFFSRYAYDQCCNLVDQLGFGLTAFSSLRDRFGLNTQDITEYYAFIKNGSLPLNRGLIRTEDDQLRWHIVLPLKNSRVDKDFYRRRTGKYPEEVFPDKLARLKQAGLIMEDGRFIALTEDGRFFADEVCHQFHQPRYIPFIKEAYAFSPGNLNPYNE